jgi:hypothetical protein
LAGSKSIPKREYSDLALNPIDDDEIATRELFRNDAAQAYVSQERRLRAAQQHGQMVARDVLDSLTISLVGE